MHLDSEGYLSQVSTNWPSKVHPTIFYTVRSASLFGLAVPGKLLVEKVLSKFLELAQTKSQK